MRVGMDATFLHPSARHTGMGVYTHCLVQALAALPHQLEIHLLGYGERPPQIPGAFQWHAIPRLPALRADLWLSHQMALPLLVSKIGLDVLHVPGVNIRLSQPCIPLMKTCPLVVTMHDAIPLLFYGRLGPALPWRLRVGYWLSLKAVARAQCIITVSETSRRDISYALSSVSSRVTVALNGVPELPLPTPAQAATTRGELGIPGRFLLYVGSFEPRKNLAGAVAAYARAKDSMELPPLVLVVEKHSGHKDRTLQRIAQLGVRDSLIWLDALDDAQLAALYSGADMFISPSLYEGFGFSPLQAMRAGVPVIAGRAGAAPEVLGDAALLIDPTDTDALASAITRLWGDSDTRNLMRERGINRASRFRWMDAARDTVRAYERAAGLQPDAVQG